MKHMITGALLLSATLLTAQEKKAANNDKPVTVRVKKVEMVNGVEKITDTTYTTTEGSVPVDMRDAKGDLPKDGRQKKVVIITGDGDGEAVRVSTSDRSMDEQLEKVLKSTCKDGNIEKIVTVDVDAQENGDGKKKVTRVIILKNVRIVEPTDADAKMVSKQTGLTDGKLSVEKMQFYPNPTNGTFKLDFTLPEKGNTEIMILNMEGKAVYTEELKDFKGHYEKEVDISANPKGIYFVRVKQGAHAQLKKIVLE